MKFNTDKRIEVDEGTPKARWEWVPDLYLYPENLQDAFVLDAFFRRFEGKTVRVIRDGNANPAFSVRFEEVE